MAANGRLRTRGSGNRRSQQLQRPPGNSAEPAIPPMGYDGGGRQASWGNGYEAPAYYPPPPANGGPWVPLGASSQTQAQNGGWVVRPFFVCHFERRISLLSFLLVLVDQ